MDFVAHNGGLARGSFVHSLVLTDIASGWTECIALPVREQSLVVEGVIQVRHLLPFVLQGLDTDNDGAFINETLIGYCKAQDLKLTRSRPYRKNDQAWVEQKNGAVVRRLVGYGRLEGLEATRTLAKFYGLSRLYVNFFQPSFKLLKKERQGGKVSKRYSAPLTPCERLLANPHLGPESKERLRGQAHALDPIALLQQIRELQRALAIFATGDTPRSDPAMNSGNVSTFLQGLAVAWKDGEVRPTHRKKQCAERWWRTRVDPFEQVWPSVLMWLEQEPAIEAKTMMQRLTATHPEIYSKAQLRTLQRRVSAWRQERARALILGISNLAISETLVETTTTAK